MRILCLSLVFICLAMPSGAPAQPELGLDEIVVLARGGATGLALALLDEHQAVLDGEEWAQAERERLHILAATGAWANLTARAGAWPDGVPPAFLDWAQERRVEAFLHLGDHRAAQDLLRQLIWVSGAPDAETLQRLRLLLIRSHLAAGDVPSALTALRRHAQDYGAPDDALRALHAEALLSADRPREALAILGEGDAHPLRALRWAARLRSDPDAAGAVLEEAIRVGSDREAPAVPRAAAWAMAAEAALRIGNRAASVAAMERALVIADTTAVTPALLQVQASDLWRAYREWGRQLGNAAQLIVGIAQDWLDEAERREATQPAEARALYAELSTHRATDPMADQARLRFARSLLMEPGGDTLLGLVFLDAGLFADPEEIPPPVRALLVDEVLRRGDIALASRLITDLENSPAEAGAESWALRRARVLVLGGHSGEAHDALKAFMTAYPDYDIDRTLQVLFDMQSAGAHAEAYALLSDIHGREDLSPQGRRELLFWMGDSQRALGKHPQAARLYLRSAGLIDPVAMDPWAQSARFQAAEALAAAGLDADARNILAALANATEDSGRRAMLLQRMDQLTR